MKIWIGNLTIGFFASVIVWIFFPLADKWGSKQPAGVRPAARAAVIMSVFFLAMGFSIAVLIDHNIPQRDFTLYYPIWMVPFFVTLIFATIKANRAYRKSEDESRNKLFSNRIHLESGEQLLHTARAHLFGNFENSGCNCSLIITSLRLIFEPLSTSAKQRFEEHLLTDILNVTTKNTFGFIPGRIQIALTGQDRKLDFTVQWGSRKVVELINNLTMKK